MGENKNAVVQNSIIQAERIDVFKKLEVDLSGPDISDVIITTVSKKRVRMYQNSRTGKCSENIHDVIEKRRFIVVKSRSNGFYVFEAGDVLGIMLVTMTEKDGKFMWEEVCRTYISRDGFSYNTSAFINALDECEDYYSICDICGQTVLKDIKEINPRGWFSNVSAGGKQTLFKYFNGTPTVYSDEHPFSRINIHLYSKARLEEIIHAFDEIEKKHIRLGHMLNINYKEDGRFTFKYTDKDDMPIPEDAFKMMKEYAKRWLEEEYKKTMERSLFNEQKCVVTILQKQGDCVVQRFFYLFSDIKYPYDETEIDFVEKKRIWFQKEQTLLLLEQQGVLVWRDDLTGTVFEHTSYILDNQITLFKEVLDNDKKKLDYIFWEFKGMYGLDYQHAIDTAAAMGRDHVLEKMIKKIESMLNNNCNWMDKDDIKKSLSEVSRQLITYLQIPLTSSPNTVVCSNETLLDEDIYGKVDTTKDELHKALGVPKFLLEYMIKQGEITKIGRIKYIFEGICSKESKYFYDMSENQCVKLVEFVLDKDVRISERRRPNILKNLIIYKGPANINRYVEFLRTLDIYEGINYDNYMKILARDAMGDNIFKNSEWRLRGDRLRSASSIVTNLSQFVYSGGYKEIKKAFARIKETGKPLLYSDKNYHLKYPDEPKDLIQEGIELHHCVKEFLQPVANGETTILFIRKNQKPDEPYFTLEIRNGAIRQCHGFDNCNVTEGSALDEFLRDFCKKRDIVYCRGEIQLNAV